MVLILALNYGQKVKWIPHTDQLELLLGLDFRLLRPVSVRMMDFGHLTVCARHLRRRGFTRHIQHIVAIVSATIDALQQRCLTRGQVNDYQRHDVVQRNFCDSIHFRLIFSLIANAVRPDPVMYKRFVHFPRHKSTSCNGIEVKCDSIGTVQTFRARFVLRPRPHT